jgi:hypothetical protein
MRLASSLSASLLLVVAVPAAADTADQPVFAIMDSSADPSHVAADLAMSIQDGEDGMLMRTNLRGQFVTLDGFGGYAAIAASTLAVNESDQSDTAVGNLELGGVYQYRGSATSTVGLRVGLILPTGTDIGDESVGGLWHGRSTVLVRPADFPTAVTDTTWLRVGVSPTFEERGFFARLDLGFDIPVLEDDDELDDGDDTDEAFGHVNVGVGYIQDRVSGTLELQNVFTMSDPDPDLGERFFHVGAMSVRYHAGSVAPFVALSMPLDDEIRGDIVMLTAGLAAPL